MHRVVVTDYLQPPADLEQVELEGVARVECFGARTHGELEGKLRDADGLIVFHEVTVPASVILGLDRCKVIVRCGVGYDAVDVEAAGERGIPVCNVPDYGVDEVADHAMALMLACNRGLLRVERGLRRTLRPWDRHAVGSVPRLAGRTLGVIGLGRIGGAAALRGKAFKMRVLACDPYLRPGMEKVLGVEMVDLSTLLRESDVVTLHVPLTAETRGMIDASALGVMKPTALLINTARGAVVDGGALASALEAGRIAGAGIDVLADEPPDASNPLIRLWRSDEGGAKNLVMTPHTAFFSDEGCVEMRSKAAQEVRRVLEGKRPRNCVNAEYLENDLAGQG